MVALAGQSFKFNIVVAGVPSRRGVSARVPPLSPCNLIVLVVSSELVEIRVVVLLKGSLVLSLEHLDELLLVLLPNVFTLFRLFAVRLLSQTHASLTWFSEID